MNYFEKVERNFNCAGWCTYYPIYVFSNVNYGTPKYYVLYKLENLVTLQ